MADPSPDAKGGEGAEGVGTKRVQGEAVGGAGGSEEASKRAKHEPKEEQAVPGHRKFLLTGLSGIKQEVLQGQLDRAGISYNRLWKARKQDAGEVWLKDNEVFLKVSPVAFLLCDLRARRGRPCWPHAAAPGDTGLTRRVASACSMA
jgi:hypothetical protein